MPLEFRYPVGAIASFGDGEISSRRRDLRKVDFKRKNRNLIEQLTYCVGVNVFPPPSLRVSEAKRAAYRYIDPIYQVSSRAIRRIDIALNTSDIGISQSGLANRRLQSPLGEVSGVQKG